jgi:hypothetical protein
MTDEVKVILDLSDEVQTLLEQQQVDLYREIQQELPSIRLERQSDPDAPKGSRDIVTIIVAATSLVTALTPLILGILKQFTPPNRSVEWLVEETETRKSDGSSTIQRKRFLSSNEQYLREQQTAQSKTVTPSGSKGAKKKI